MTDNEPTIVESSPLPTQPSLSYAPPMMQQATLGSDQATMALIFGILGLVLFTPLGLVSFFIGRKVRQESRETGIPVDSTMTAAYWIGVVCTAFLAVAIIALAVVLIIAATTVR